MLSSLVVATIAVPKYQKKPTLPPKIVEELPMPTPVEVEVALVEEDVEEEPVVALPEKKEPLKLPKSPPPLKAVKIPDVEPPLKTMPSPVMAVARPYTPDMVKKEEPVVTPADLVVEESEPVPVVPVQEPPQKKRKILLKLVIASVTIALTGTVFSGVFASRPAFALFML